MNKVIKEILKTPRGPQIILSRTDERLIKELFTQEVPEISLKQFLTRNSRKDVKRNIGQIPWKLEILEKPEIARTSVKCSIRRK